MLKYNGNDRYVPLTMIVTCFNEAQSVPAWCASFLQMSKLPQELIIKDSESTDETINLIKKGLAAYGGNLIIIKEKCNISKGRNDAIEVSSFENIVVTDFGVIFDRYWLEKMALALDASDWVGGGYTLIWKNSVQKAFCRLFNRPGNKRDFKTFLPSSRSFGIKRGIFYQVGRYDEGIAIGEDTELVLRLRRTRAKYEYVPDAVVYWMPRSTIKSIYLQNYRYAYWDGIIKQNIGRLNHIAYCLMLLMLPHFFLILDMNIYIGIILSFVILYVKASRNTLRSESGLPSAWDLIVYFVTLMGSSIGYLHGLLSRK